MICRLIIRFYVARRKWVIRVTLLHYKINCKFSSFDVIPRILESFLVGVTWQKGWCLHDNALLKVISVSLRESPLRFFINPHGSVIHLNSAVQFCRTIEAVETKRTKTQMFFFKKVHSIKISSLKFLNV